MGLFADITGELLPSFMTLSLRTALPYVTSGVLGGLSGNEILRTLTEAGLGVNRQAGLTLIKAVRTGVGQQVGIPGVHAGDYPEPGLFTTAAYPTAHNFTYIYQVTGTNPFTGELEVIHISIVSDSVLTSDEAQEMAESLIDSGQSNNALEDVDVELKQVKVSPYFQPGL